MVNAATQISRLISTGTRLIEPCYRPLPKSEQTGKTVSAIYNQIGTKVSSPSIQALFSLQQLVRGVDAQMRVVGKDLLIDFGNPGIRINRPTIQPSDSSLIQQFDQLAKEFQEALAKTDKTTLQAIRFPLIRFAKVYDPIAESVSLLISDVFDRAMTAALLAPEDVEATQDRKLPECKFAYLPLFIRHLDAQIRIVYPYSLLIDEDRRREYGNARDAAGMKMVSSMTLNQYERECADLTQDSPAPGLYPVLLKQLTESMSCIWRYNRKEVMETLEVPDYFPEEIQQFYKGLLSKVIKDALEIPRYSMFSAAFGV